MDRSRTSSSSILVTFIVTLLICTTVFVNGQDAQAASAPPVPVELPETAEVADAPVVTGSGDDGDNDPAASMEEIQGFSPEVYVIGH